MLNCPERDACEDDISRHICGFSKLNNIDTTRSSQVHGAIFIWLSLASCPLLHYVEHPAKSPLQEIGGEVDPTPPRIVIYSP